MVVLADSNSARIRVAPSVIDPSELAARVESALDSIDTKALDLTPPRRTGSRKPYVEAARRAENLHSLWRGTFPPGIERGRGARGFAQRFVKTTVRRVTHWYVEPRFVAQHEINAEMARFATDAVLAIRRTHVELTEARRDLELMNRQLQTARDELAKLSQAARQRETQIHDRLDRLAVMRGSDDATSELRDQLTQVMARLGIASAHGASFDYVAFEDRFRGDSEALTKLQLEYVSKFPPPSEHGVIIDVGPGRGEMLELLREHGHEVIGVELDKNMVEVCASKGLPIVQGNGVAWLETAATNSVKGVFCAQVIEHLLTPEIERFLTAALRCLRPGGVLVVETINPRSLHALANHFFADLSHVRPVHPETLRFMCEQVGFTTVALMELSPHPSLAESDALGSDPIDMAVKGLVNSVFGYQDYAVVATK